jgi:arylsulfatase A-like enzyme
MRADYITDRAVEWIGRHGGERFFLYLHYMDVHKPYMPPEKFAVFGETDMDRYDGEIAFVSSELDRLFEHLSSSRLLDRTLVILTADHGEQFMEHGSKGHGKSLYTEEVHVPLIIRPPGGAGGRRVKTAVRLIDIAPTLTDLFDLRPLTSAMGASLRPAIEGSEPPDRPVWAELKPPYDPDQHILSLTEADTRYIVHDFVREEGGLQEVYDLATDPAEQINLAGGRQAETLEYELRKENYLARCALLHKSLIVVQFVVPVTGEQAAQLRALGYITEGTSVRETPPGTGGD